MAATVIPRLLREWKLFSNNFLNFLSSSAAAVALCTNCAVALTAALAILAALTFCALCALAFSGLGAVLAGRNCEKSCSNCENHHNPFHR